MDLRTCLSQDIGWTRLSFDVFKADISREDAVELARSDSPRISDRFQSLWRNEQVSELWPEGFDSSRVHLIIQKSTSDRPDPEHILDGEDQLKKFVETQNQSVKYYQYMSVSSHDSEIANFIKAQKGSHRVINGRPVYNSTLPISLYHKAFYEFSLAATRAPSFQHLAKTDVFDFICACQGLYEDRHERFRGLYDCLHGLLKVSFLRLQIPETSEDGVVARHNGAYVLINEWRNELGAGGSDPILTSATSYKQYWGEDTMKRIREACCCPSFILVIAGPWVCVQGAITTDSDTIVQPLTDFIWMGPRHLKADGIQEAGQLFEALSSGLKSLKSFYNTLAPVAQQGPSFPWITHFPDETGRDIQFRYTAALGDSRTVFRAETFESPPRQMVVKFTRKYHGDAHQLMAAEGYAPKLYFDASSHPSFPRPGDLIMVITEYVPQAPLSLDYLKAYKTLPDALDILHGQGLVFGDLRPQNIIVPAAQPDQAMLIDFDWCGMDGEDRYPWDINTNGIKWARGVGPGAIMSKTHDWHMLEYILAIFE